jgi:hypothetical protein
MSRRSLVRDTISSVLLLCALGICGLAYVTQNGRLYAFRSFAGKRYDVLFRRGDLVLHILHDYKHDTPLKWGGVRDCPPLSDDHSWWEDIGHRIDKRVRFAGFEWAGGKFLPPFIWLHRTAPATVVHIPFWAMVFIPSAVPFGVFSLWFGRRIETRLRESAWLHARGGR